MKRISNIFVWILCLSLLLHGGVLAQDAVDTDNKTQEDNNEENIDKKDNVEEKDDKTQENNELKTTTYEEEIEILHFKTIRKEDPELYEDEYEIELEGVDGEQKIIYEVKTVDGKEVSRKRIGSPQIIKQPIDQIVRIGTKPREQEPLDTKLNYLEIQGAKLNQEFDENTFSYILEIEEGATEIDFYAEAKDDQVTIEGLGKVDPFSVKEHKIVVKNEEGLFSTYKFVWTVNNNVEFKISDSDGNPIVVIYDNEKENPFKGLQEVEDKINGKQVKLFKDATGNTIIAIKAENQKYTGWYHIKNGELIQILKKAFVDKGTVYIDVDFYEIEKELATKYGLELTNISDLNIDGYKINSKTYDGKYILRLTNLISENSWYEYDENTKSLNKLNFSDSIQNEELSEYLNYKEKKDNAIYYIVGGVLLVNIFVIVIFIVSTGKKKNQKSM